MGIAVVFPGQGSQVPGAGRTWVDHPAWSVVGEAEDALGRRLGPLITDIDVDLSPTRESQLSVLLLSLVAWRAVESESDDDSVLGREVRAMAGHSLGQITALIASGALSLADGIRLADARATATTAAQALQPGGLVALLGATEELAQEACDRVAASTSTTAWVSTLNGAGQVVVGGPIQVLDAVADAALDLGARRARRLAVDGAFHTPMMQPAVDVLGPVLEQISFQAPRWPVLANHDAQVVRSAHGWVERLTRHLVEPVRWSASVEQLPALGVGAVIEVGPGTALAGLVRRLVPDMTVLGVAAPEDLPVTPATAGSPGSTGSADQTGTFGSPRPLASKAVAAR